MKILNIIAQKPHSTGSGVYLTETVREMVNMGHDAAVVAGVFADDEVSFPEGVTFYPLVYETEELPFPVCGMSDEMPYRSTAYRNMTDEMASFFVSAFAKTLKLAVAEFKPEVIICHHLYFLSALARRLFPDMTLWGICHGSDLRQLYTNPFRREEIISGVAGLERVCCLHEKQAAQVVSCYGVDPQKITIVGVGYNDRLFFERGIRKPHREKRIVYAGKISEKKGVMSLLAALDHLGWKREDFSLRLAGGWGTEEIKGDVERRIAEGGWDVKLLGALSQEKLAREFSNSDVFVLPSFYEGLPLVLAEAMACGCNVVCTDLTGVRPWMDEMAPAHGIRFVTPPDMLDADTPDPQSLPDFEMRLARAIREAAATPRANVDLSRLTWRNVTRRMLDL